MTKLLLPKVIGNRGAAAYAPENTLSAIHTAADLGIEWVTISVKLTRDGEAVAFHDESLLRTTGSEGLLRETDLEDLRELDAGSWMGDSFIGEKIPTLEEMLDAAIERNLGVSIDICPCPGLEIETAEAALDIATRIWPEDIAPPLVSSASHVTLETARDMIPEWPRGLILPEHVSNWKEIAEYVDASVIKIDGDNATEDQIDEYIEAQKPVIAYTINDPEQARALLRLGVDGFISDSPDVIRDAVEVRH